MTHISADPSVLQGERVRETTDLGLQHAALVARGVSARWMHYGALQLYLLAWDVRVGTLSQVTVLFRRVGLGPCEGNVLEAWLGGPSVLAGPTVWSLPVVCFRRWMHYGALQLYLLAWDVRVGTLSVLQEGGVTVLFSGLRLAARGVSARWMHYGAFPRWPFYSGGWG